jgi:hypothetical protein
MYLYSLNYLELLGLYICFMLRILTFPPQSQHPRLRLFLNNFSSLTGRGLLESKCGSDNPKNTKPNRNITQTRTTQRHDVFLTRFSHVPTSSGHDYGRSSPSTAATPAFGHHRGNAAAHTSRQVVSRLQR